MPLGKPQEEDQGRKKRPTEADAAKRQVKREVRWGPQQEGQRGDRGAGRWEDRAVRRQVAVQTSRVLRTFKGENGPRADLPASNPTSVIHYPCQFLFPPPILRITTVPNPQGVD